MKPHRGPTGAWHPLGISVDVGGDRGDLGRRLPSLGKWVAVCALPCHSASPGPHGSTCSRPGMRDSSYQGPSAPVTTLCEAVVPGLWEQGLLTKPWMEAFGPLDWLSGHRKMHTEGDRHGPGAADLCLPAAHWYLTEDLCLEQLWLC